MGNVQGVYNNNNMYMYYRPSCDPRLTNNVRVKATSVYITLYTQCCLRSAIRDKTSLPLDALDA